MKPSQIMTLPERRGIEDPIRYHCSLLADFGGWALACKSKPRTLLATTERAIRTRGARGVIESPREGLRPAVLTLPLYLRHSLNVYFTRESWCVLIRGYSWKVDREPLDDMDGGGFYSDFVEGREVGEGLA
jgi:hypothetical protein